MEGEKMHERAGKIQSTHRAITDILTTTFMTKKTQRNLANNSP